MNQQIKISHSDSNMRIHNEICHMKLYFTAKEYPNVTYYFKCEKHNEEVYITI